MPRTQIVVEIPANASSQVKTHVKSQLPKEYPAFDFVFVETPGISYPRAMLSSASEADFGTFNGSSEKAKAMFIQGITENACRLFKNAVRSEYKSPLISAQNSHC